MTEYDRPEARRVARRCSVLTVVASQGLAESGAYEQPRAAWEADEPPRLRDLPGRHVHLRRAPGIGQKSFELVESALLETLTGPSANAGR